MAKNYDIIENIKDNTEILALLREIKNERQECLIENVFMKMELKK